MATALNRLQDYTRKLKDVEYDLEHIDEEDDYEARITKTLQSLQNQVKQQRDALEMVLLCSAKGY